MLNHVYLLPAFYYNIVFDLQIIFSLCYLANFVREIVPMYVADLEIRSGMC